MNSWSRVLTVGITLIGVGLVLFDLIFGKQGWLSTLGEHGLIWVGMLLILLSQIQQVRLLRQQQKLDLQQQQLLMNSLQVGVTVVDHERGFSYVNPAYANLVGLEPSELLGKQPELITHPDDQVQLINATSLRKGGRANLYRTRLIHADGSEIPVEIDAVPLYQWGKVIGTLASVTDLRPMQSERAQVVVLNHQLKSIVEATRALITAKDSPDYIRVLSLLGKGMEVGRIIVYRQTSGQVFDSILEWCADGLSAVPRQAYQPYKPWLETFEAGNPVVCAAGDFPLEFRDCLLGAGVESVLQAPIWVAGELWGLVWLEDYQPREWSAEESVALDLIGSSIAQVILRHRSQATPASAKAQPFHPFAGLLNDELEAVIESVFEKTPKGINQR